MLVLLATALAWSPLDVPSIPAVDRYAQCENEVLDPMPVELAFTERVFVEARDCPEGDPCCAVGGFAWWEPSEGPAITLLQAPGCAADECGRCGFELTAVGQRERRCEDGRERLVFRPRFTVTKPIVYDEAVFPDRLVWVLFPGMPDYRPVPVEEDPTPPAPAVFAVHEIEIPDTRDATETVAGP
ncbi:MAG: hypothetical protein KC912_15725 [Proteobacteria bacterium]|nr:hypothetical protein [Pseudomonadota bacterium]